MLWAALALVTAGTVRDLYRHEIPDVVPAALLLLAFWSAARMSPHAWVSLAGGFAVALGVGVALFATGGFGGGDVKLITALGALLGVRDLLTLLFYTALAGGALAVIAAARGKRDLAYAPAIALGLLIMLVRRGLP